MSRPTTGWEVLEQAKVRIATARTVEELRAAQAVVLPLELGISLQRAAGLIGVSPGWACRLRNRFARIARGKEAPRSGRGGRYHHNLTPEQEVRFLEPFLATASQGGVLVVASIRQALEERLGRKVALSSIYNLLHRHGWRKLAPDRRHPEGDPEAQQAWKKN
ncbi:MAG TPA: winged helix-turn-helix domain-containing protein [Anaerolineales bacterium]